MTTYSTNTDAGQRGEGIIAQTKARIAATTKTTEFKILTVLLTAVMLWAAAIATFGYAALIVVALALVPTAFVCLMLITVGK